MSDLFAQRLANFAAEGELTAFNLAVVADALDIIADLAAQNIGGETVEQRIGEYKSWDPEVFKVDKDVENRFIERLEQLGRPIVLLSEEIGRKEINPDAAGERMYCPSDPFTPACCVVGDGVHRTVAFANENGAFVAKLSGTELESKFELNADYRKLMGRVAPETCDGASIESYAMKPAKFLMPIVDKYRKLLAPFKFFLPNGGPYAFADVAEGKIDCYFAPRQPFVDIFPGTYIAKQAGCVVTNFDGSEVVCSDNVKSLHDVVASANPALHEEVLALIAECKKG